MSRTMDPNERLAQKPSVEPELLAAARAAGDLAAGEEAPPRVVRHDEHWEEEPFKARSPRLRFWAERIFAGWRPPTWLQVASEEACVFFGVWMWEHQHVLVPLLCGASPDYLYLVGETSDAPNPAKDEEMWALIAAHQHSQAARDLAKAQGIRVYLKRQEALAAAPTAPEEAPAAFLAAPEAARFLLESGLLFELNRRTLHPFGLALAIEHDEAGDAFRGLVDVRYDLEGMVFGGEGIREGQEKLRAYLAARGTKALAARQRALGFVVEPLEGDPPHFTRHFLMAGFAGHRQLLHVYPQFGPVFWEVWVWPDNFQLAEVHDFLKYCVPGSFDQYERIQQRARRLHVGGDFEEAFAVMSAPAAPRAELPAVPPPIAPRVAWASVVAAQEAFVRSQGWERTENEWGKGWAHRGDPREVWDFERLLELLRPPAGEPS